MLLRTGMALAGTLILAAGPAAAGEADVVEVAVHKTGERTYRVDVTVRHADAGWDHYADKWDVLLPDGTVLGTRTLYHPHVEEQPFTRSLGDVRVPAGAEAIEVRVHDSVHGYGGETRRVRLLD